MAAFDLTARDEGRHLPGTDALWGESWYHDFAAADGSYGGYLRLGLYPNQKLAWYWVHLVRDGEPLVVVRDHEVPCPAFDARPRSSRSTWRHPRARLVGRDGPAAHVPHHHRGHGRRAREPGRRVPR